MEFSFDKLPEAVGQLALKLDRIEQILLKQKQPSNDDADEILSVDGASQLLTLAKATVYCLVSQKKLPHMKQGKKLYFSKKELTAWLKAGSRPVGDDQNALLDEALIVARKSRRG